MNFTTFLVVVVLMNARGFALIIKGMRDHHRSWEAWERSNQAWALSQLKWESLMHNAEATLGNGVRVAAAAVIAEVSTGPGTPRDQRPAAAPG